MFPCFQHSWEALDCRYRRVPFFRPSSFLKLYEAICINLLYHPSVPNIEQALLLYFEQEPNISIELIKVFSDEVAIKYLAFIFLL